MSMSASLSYLPPRSKVNLPFCALAAVLLPARAQALAYTFRRTRTLRLTGCLGLPAALVPSLRSPGGIAAPQRHAAFSLIRCYRTRLLPPRRFCRALLFIGSACCIRCYALRRVLFLVLSEIIIPFCYAARATSARVVWRITFPAIILSWPSVGQSDVFCARASCGARTNADAAHSETCEERARATPRAVSGKGGTWTSGFSVAMIGNGPLLGRHFAGCGATQFYLCL